MSNPLAVYRCQTDGGLVLEHDFEKHAGHRVVIASSVGPIEYARLLWYRIWHPIQRRLF